MSTFSWLLISDLHLKSTHAVWSQNVVLRDMVRDIELKKETIPKIQFVIVSGDLAHGGKQEQYKIVEKFLDELIRVLGLARTDVFMVPGNHDIDRDKCELTFHGCRSEFQSAEKVEKYLSNDHERSILLQRLSAFSDFEQRYSVGLPRQLTADGLAYFSRRLIGHIPIGIVGLNSAIACGNDKDERSVVLGDRPIIDICEVIRESDIRLVIGIMHHPPYWLQHFDRRTFDERFLPLCDVLHRGHLHEQEVKLLYTSSSTNCLAIAAGAGYVWRQFANSYSIVSIDTADAECSVQYFEYNNHSGRFEIKSSVKQSIRLRGQIPGGVSEISAAISEFGTIPRRFAPYLAALILERITEVPVHINGRVFFASPSVVDEADDEHYTKVLKKFLNVRNSLLAFSSTAPLSERMNASKVAVVAFSNKLQDFVSMDKSFADDIQRRNEVSAEFCDQAQLADISFIATMKQFAIERDWDGLEVVARRYRSILKEVPDVQHSANLHLCLALANNDDRDKQAEAVILADELIARDGPIIDDYHLCFSLHCKLGNDERAEYVLRKAIGQFNKIPADFSADARRFAINTGKKDLSILLLESNGDSHE